MFKLRFTIVFNGSWHLISTIRKNFKIFFVNMSFEPIVVRHVNEKQLGFFI
ncbi:hypothetical protein VIBNIMADA3020_310010 [Vibrio nigripulchritudo MADA3020]|nr:hypothetical protein VIBNIMADA3020_310010 [Vibrio nigripulchritudo MADA3020]CCN55641.1 hypothetical protein VIBNIMADA3021_790179 [Vibrio nigripulchritudo MADA3021]